MLIFDVWVSLNPQTPFWVNIISQTIKKDPVIKVVKKDGDIDPVETNEWLESLSSVLENDG